MLRELAQTSHVGEGLMPREEMTIEGIAAVQTGNAQGILQKTGEVNADLEQVNVDSFTLYVARKFWPQTALALFMFLGY